MILIKNGTVVSDGASFKGSILIDGGIIRKIFAEKDTPDSFTDFCTKNGIDSTTCDVIDASGKLVIPGAIDTHVHFREPGAEQKGTIASESAAAVKGGVTSYMDMPNNTPQTTTIERLENKHKIAEASSYANWSFFLGASTARENIKEIEALDPKHNCGVKLFLASTTGDMKITDDTIIDDIFRTATDKNITISAHCEDDRIINGNLERIKEEYGNDIPFSCHPLIRSSESCVSGTRKALELAMKHKTRFHLAHLSCAEEIPLIAQAKMVCNLNCNMATEGGGAGRKIITAETCAHYVWFDADSYSRLGARLKCNPAVKYQHDRESIIAALKSGVIDNIATDHAPHLPCDKEGGYLRSAGGLPTVGHSLQMMLELAYKGVFTIEEVVSKMCTAPAQIWDIENRGHIREGYAADIAIIEHGEFPVEVNYKCGWSPLEGETFHYRVAHTLVNGTVVVYNGKLTGEHAAQRLTFSRSF